MLRYIMLFLAALAMVGCGSKPAQESGAKPAETKAADAAPAAEAATPSNGEPPDTILIQSPAGNVTFTHKKHYERLNGDCSKCHPKVFPQSRAPLNYKKALHRAAEASMTSCAYCHSIGNSAFAADSNCTKCHAEREH